jgi:hypothetical protein
MSGEGKGAGDKEVTECTEESERTKWEDRIGPDGGIHPSQKKN